MRCAARFVPSIVALFSLALAGCGPGSDEELAPLPAALVAIPRDAGVADAGTVDAGPGDAGPGDAGADAGDGGCPPRSYPDSSGACQPCPPDGTTPTCSDGSNGHTAQACPPGMYCAVHDEVCNELGLCLPNPDGGRGDGGGGCDGGIIDSSGQCCMVGQSCGVPGSHFGTVPDGDGGPGYCVCMLDGDGGTDGGADGGAGDGGAGDGGGGDGGGGGGDGGGGGGGDGGADAGQCTPGQCWSDPPYNACQLPTLDGGCADVYCIAPSVPCYGQNTSTGLGCCGGNDGGAGDGGSGSDGGGGGGGDVCGDGVCGYTEDCSSCAQDCGACQTCDAGTTTAGAAFQSGANAATACPPPPPDDCEIKPGDVLTVWSPTDSVKTINNSVNNQLVCRISSIFSKSTAPNHTQVAVTGGNWTVASVAEAIEGGVRVNVLGPSVGKPMTGIVHVGAMYSGTGIEDDCLATGHLAAITDVYRPNFGWKTTRAQGAANALAAVGTPYQLVAGDGTFWWEDNKYFSKFKYWTRFGSFPSKMYCSELAFMAYNGDYTTMACGGGLPGEPPIPGCPNWIAGRDAPSLHHMSQYGFGGYGYETDAVASDFVHKCTRRAGEPILKGGAPNPHYLQKVPNVRD